MKRESVQEPGFRSDRAVDKDALAGDQCGRQRALITAATQVSLLATTSICADILMRSIHTHIHTNG